MAANGGGAPFVKKEEESDSNNPMLLENHVDKNNNNNNNNNKGISIAERRAAKCGFNASIMNAARFRTTGLTPPARSPYFTVPPGISPSALLDSPVMLPNAQAQLSPTTGTFQSPSPNHENLKLKLKSASNGDNTIAMESSSDAEAEALGVPLSELSCNNFRAENKPFEEFEYSRNLQEMTQNNCFEDTLAKTEVLGGSNNKSREVECLNLQPSNNRNQMFSSQNDQSGKEIRSTHPNQEKHQKGAYTPKEATKCSEDGFYWRKYGQKHVKGSEYPRSYYKCTNTNCPVTKKVERSHDGHITEIVYKGSHNHPQPQPFKRPNEMSEINEGSGPCFKTEAATGTGKDAAFSSDWRPDILDGTSTASFLSDFPDPLSRSMSTFQPVETQEFPPTFGTHEVDDRNEASPESVSFNEEDDENGECEPRKRKRDSFPSETAVPRSTREPKVVVQIESDIDILDDGYRWRKYGQKVVKGNPNPRSYYKCTTPGCPVRKHVERAASDIKSVITTYEGKHNHEVPSSKTGSLVISDVANLPPALTNSTVSTPSTMAQKPDAMKSGKQVQDLPLYLERKPMLNYNELMRSNLPGNFSNDLNFGASSVYPLSFPPFHSLPYGSLLMNSNPMKTYSSSKIYPMIPDYLSLPSQINPVPAGSGNVPLGGNFHYNNYTAIQPSTRGQEMRDSQAKIVKPKEEQRNEDELYDTCLSIPNHGNRTM